jgi:hypothetical protein
MLAISKVICSLRVYIDSTVSGEIAVIGNARRPLLGKAAAADERVCAMYKPLSAGAGFVSAGSLSRVLTCLDGGV